MFTSFCSKNRHPFVYEKEAKTTPVGMKYKLNIIYIIWKLALLGHKIKWIN